MNALIPRQKSSVPILDKNHMMCKLIKTHFIGFFDDIYIPYKYFRKGKWNIKKIISSNKDALYYNPKFASQSDKYRFSEIFDRYAVMIEDILSPDNKLNHYLKRWTDVTDNKFIDRSKNSYLKSIFIDKKYRHISPTHIVKLFIECSKETEIKTIAISNFEKILDEIISKAQKYIAIFKAAYDLIIDKYVYFKAEITDSDTYELFNSIFLAIINFADKMIELNIYTIHVLVNDIIGELTPFDDINYYTPECFGGKDLYVI